MVRSPSIQSGDLRSGMKRGGLEESFGRTPRETDELTEEEESSDYTRVLITVNGYTGAKLPRLKSSF